MAEIAFKEAGHLRSSKEPMGFERIEGCNVSLEKFGFERAA
jgi:hypothetical protein